MSAGVPTPSALPRPAPAEAPPAPGLDGERTHGGPDPRVADAVSRLGELDGLPLVEQVEVFADIHRRLAAVLSDPDSQA